MKPDYNTNASTRLNLAVNDSLQNSCDRNRIFRCSREF